MHDAGTEAIAIALQDYIHAKRRETGYDGPVDLVCHSMGTCIARYLLEVIDGGAQEEQVRLLVGIGPPNNGSSMAELFNDPDRGPEVIQDLAGVFVPRDYDPADDIIVQEFRPGSGTVAALRAAGTRSDITYRIILTANLTATPAFFPVFDGRTWELSPEESGGRRTPATASSPTPTPTSREQVSMFSHAIPGILPGIRNTTATSDLRETLR